jgi:hypothetical protein
MKREEVFELINKERSYQNSMYDSDRPENTLSFDELNHVAQWVLYIEAYLNRAKSKFLGGAGGRLVLDAYKENPSNAQIVHEEEVLKDLVKVAALTIACLEHRGDLLREEKPVKE